MLNPTSYTIPTDQSFQPMPGAMPEQLRLIDLTEVQHFTGLGRTTINEKLRDPESGFPQPVRHMRHNRWVLGEVLAYISSLIQSRDAAKAGAQ